MGMENEEPSNPSSSAAALDDIDDAQFQAIIRSWVVQALSKGQPDKYRKLLQDLKNVDFDDPMSISALSLRIRALSQSVSYLNENDHERLLNHVLSMSFWNCNDELADSLHDLVLNLATSSGVLVPRCLDMLVRNFLPPSCGFKVHIDCYTQYYLVTKRITSDSLKGQKAMHLSRKNDVMNRVHLTIQRIVELVPIAALRLHPIVHQRMPHRTLATEWSALYVENMLLLDSKRISPAIGSRMLLGVVDRLIEIDVEIAWEDILKDEDSSKVLLFQMDIDEPEPGDASGPGSEAQLEHALAAANKSRLQKSLDQVADKMDQLMDLTLEHLRVSAEQDRVEEIFSTLMVSFKSTVLNTYKSKFTQFLIFYVCSLAPGTCGAKFAGFLSETFLNLSVARNTRMSAAAYLASYLSRANFLPLSVIFSSVQRLVNWCVSYTFTKSDVFTMGDTGLHGVFYSACQAVMYILCFRLRDLHGDPTHRSLLKSLRLQQLIEHKLRPLHVCLPSVVEEFLRQATGIQLVNHKCTLEPSSGLEVLSFKSYGGDNRLEMFFPFDPYLLRISDRFIRPIFISWSPPHSAADDDSCDEDEAEEEEEEDAEEDEEDEVVDPSGVIDEMDTCREDGEDEESVRVFQNSLDCMSLTPPRMLPANLSHLLPIS